MYQLLFRSRWFALLWAGVTLASIGAFVSEGGGTDKLDDTAQDVREQRQMMAGGGAPPTFVEEAPLVDDTALIDPATGYDPAPMDDTDPEGAPKIVKKGVVAQPAEAEE
jgi:hypothetical protein